MVTTYVENPGDLVGSGLGVNTHTEDTGNLMTGLFLLNG
jgi:hypothetical protein